MWLAWSVTYQYYILILWRGGLCMAKRNNFQKKQTRTNLAGFLFASPWIIGFIIFGLYPIVMSMYYSLCKFNVFQPPQWIGLQNYKELFTDELFYKSLANTLYMTVVGTPLNLIVGLMTALLLNMKVKGKSIYRTIFYLPSIVPVVASSLLWLWILNPQYGLLNQMLGFLSLPQPNWLSDPAMTKPSLIIMGLWGTGGIMIIFLAALQDVPRSLYEAAEIDGASRWKRIIHIDLPCILPTVAILLILRAGSIMSVGFEKVYLMQNNLNLKHSEVIATYVYKVGIAAGGGNFSYASAIELFNSVINCALLVIVNGITRRLSDDNVSLW